MESIYDDLGSLKDCVIHDLQIDKTIGHEAYGTISEAKWEGSVVAVKEIRSIFNDVSDHQFQVFKGKISNQM